MPLIDFDHALRQGPHCNLAKIPLSAGGPLSMSMTGGLILSAITNIDQSIRTMSQVLISSICSCSFFTTLLAWKPLRLLRSIGWCVNALPTDVPGL